LTILNRPVIIVKSRIYLVELRKLSQERDKDIREVRMAKGPHLTDRIKQMIAEIYVADHQIKPGRAQEELLKRMKAEGLDEIFGSNYPSRSTVSKELKSLRERDEARSPKSQGLDEPWTIGSLSEYPMPSDVLPRLFPIWLHNQEDPSSPLLTIREARWIAQLSDMTEDTEMLRVMAEMCAEYELIAELTNTPTPELSFPGVTLHTYARLTGMPDEELTEHYKEIFKEKRPFASGTRREITMRRMELRYGKDVLMTVKPKSKKNKGGGK